MFWWIWAGSWWMACGGLTPSETATIETDPVAQDSDSVPAEIDDAEPEDTEIWDTGGRDETPDTDVAPDTDVPDSPPEDSDAPVTPPAPTGNPDGTYRGTFRLRWFAPINAGDQLCEGPVVVTVDQTAFPAVSAQFSCDWAGLLPGVAELFGYSDLEGVISGSVRANQVGAVGDLQATDNGDFNESADWTATFSGDQLSLEYDERIPLVGGIKGSFTLTR